MTTRHAYRLAVLATGCSLPLLSASCSDSFKDCTETRTCQGASGSAGVAGTPGTGGTGATGGSGTGGVGGVAGTGGAAGSGMAGAGGMGGAGMGGAGMAGMGGAGMAGMGGAGDTTAPTVVSVSPAADAKGVVEDATIQVTFSEPMNSGQAAAAFDSADLADSAVMFSWNTDATVLTISPNSPLPYASGTDPQVVLANRFSVSILTAIEDLAGNPLAARRDWSFETLREIEQIFVAVGRTVTNEIPPAGVVQECDNSPLFVGIGAGDGVSNEQVVGIANFDVSALPAGIASFETATFEATKVGIVSQPFTGLGQVVVDHTNLDFDALKAADVTSTPLRSLGVLAATAGTIPASTPDSIDVLAAVQDDYANRSARGNSSQYRLRYEVATDSDSTSDAILYGCDDRATSNTADMELKVRYLVP